MKIIGKRGAALAASLLLALALPGCMRGLIYTRTTRPLTTNFNATPVSTTRGEGDVKTFRYYIEIDWDENGIGEIAKQRGFQEVYYADIETLSILGIWTQRFVEVYGR